MSKHTPGPWSWDDTVWNYDPEQQAPWLVSPNEVRILSGRITCPSIDNARLIAAAPDLLEALKVAAQFMSIAADWNIDEAEINDEMRSTYDWLEMVNAAIAKATGEAA